MSSRKIVHEVDERGFSLLTTKLRSRFVVTIEKLLQTIIIDAATIYRIENEMTCLIRTVFPFDIHAVH